MIDNGIRFTRIVRSLDHSSAEDPVRAEFSAVDMLNGVQSLADGLYFTAAAHAVLNKPVTMTLYELFSSPQQFIVRPILLAYEDILLGLKITQKDEAYLGISRGELEKAQGFIETRYIAQEHCRNNCEELKAVNGMVLSGVEIGLCDEPVGDQPRLLDVLFLRDEKVTERLTEVRARAQALTL